MEKKSTQIRSLAGRCFNRSKIIKPRTHSPIFKTDQALWALIIVFSVLLIDLAGALQCIVHGMFYGNTNTDSILEVFLSFRLDITCLIRSNHNLYIFFGTSYLF